MPMSHCLYLYSLTFIRTHVCFYCINFLSVPWHKMSYSKFILAVLKESGSPICIIYSKSSLSRPQEECADWMVEGTSVMKRICTAMQSYSPIILYINNKATWDLHLRAIKLERALQEMWSGWRYLAEGKLEKYKGKGWRPCWSLIHVVLHMYSLVHGILCVCERERKPFPAACSPMCSTCSSTYSNCN